jgi:hypothetical protein
LIARPVHVGDLRIYVGVRHLGNPHTLSETIGRETELATIRDFIGGARGAALLTIEGPAGIGKTTVWRTGVAGPALVVGGLCVGRVRKGETQVAKGDPVRASLLLAATR